MDGSSEPVSKIPRLVLQADWETGLKNRDEKVWIGCQPFGEKTEFSDLLTSGLDIPSDSGEPLGIPCSSGDYDVQLLRKWFLQVSHKRCAHPTTFCAPREKIKVHSKSVDAMDVADVGLGVSGSSDGTFVVWDARSCEIRRQLEGHVGDVYCCRFFPSGLVVLSGGADMMLKVWSVETGECARTMIGHRQAIMALGIIERGRNVVSASRDGTVRLWDCGSGDCLATIASGCGQINSLHVGGVGDGVLRNKPNSTLEKDEREIGTEDKLVLIGSELGQLQGFDLASRSKIFSMPCQSPVNACCRVRDHLAVAGMQDGLRRTLDLRNTGTFLTTQNDSRGPILSLSGRANNSIMVSAGDGSTLIAPLNGVGQNSGDPDDTWYEFTGPDLDPVYCAKFVSGRVFTCCRDGLVRVYDFCD